MKQAHMVYIILAFGLLTTFAMTFITNKSLKANSVTSYETQNQNTLAKGTEAVESTTKVANQANNVELAIATPEVKEEPKEEIKEVEKVEEPKEETTLTVAKSYEDMTNEELINAIANGTYKLEYSANYETNTNKLSKSKGALYYAGHKETYYSQNVLPGQGLNIPGRHVADDGTVRDGEGYIVVAANTSYLSRKAVVKTTLGPGKVYDSGCASGIIDIYTNW